MAAYFDLELNPGRSMGRRRFALVIAGVAAIFALMGLRFLLLGAWPILPFMLVDVALLAWAMRASYYSARASEHLRLDETGMELVRVNPAGRTSRTRIDAGWARVELEPVRPDGNRLWIRQNGNRRHEIGRFLSPAERAEIAPVIEAGLSRWRMDRG